ncbi:MAG: lasso peptide isopeptide bond-forming cyclase [Methanobacterium sp.]|jgi:asparagine synthase (glutamine-hydrolysing)
MSAITGIFYRDGRKVDPELIKKMNDRLSHRGPDGSAIWCEGSVALGHQMLWTTPESLHEKLPFHDEKAGLVITADARIDNRKELSEELDIEDKEDVSDSYFILKAYEKWGEKCPEYLLGDFAFAIWDENEEKLFCARDHMGVKPFYYYLDEEMFVFGTGIKALFCVPGVPRELNELKIVYFFMLEFTDKKFTFYKYVFRLPAAHSLVICKRTMKLKKYWELNPEFLIKMDSDEEYIDAFSKIFAEAVNCRMRSAFPIGFELSGGLDSSSLVCMARYILKDKMTQNVLNTFGYSFKEIPEVNERYYVKQVVNKGGIIHQFVYGDNVSPMENMKYIIWFLEQPHYSPYYSIIWELYKKMYKNKIRISLSGNGGDATIFHGNYCIKDIASKFQIKKLISELNSYSKRVNQSFIHSFISQVIFQFLPIEIKNFYLFKIRKTKNLDFILNSRIENKFGGKSYLNKLLIHPYEASTKTARKHHYYLLNNLSFQSDMEHMDKIASAFNIEPRYPYFDKKLIEFCYGIPNEMKSRFGWGRYLQRIALQDILPPEIQWRYSKTRFSPIINKNLLLFEKNRLKEFSNLKNNIISDYVNLNLINDKYQKYISGKDYNSSDVLNLWLIMILDFWLGESEILGVKC